MRERTPSADDTPKRAPPAPPREADIAGNKATGGSTEFYQTPKLSLSASGKMVASTNNLEDLGVSHPGNASTEFRLQQQGHSCRSAPTAQDKRSRLSNVINNLRKKVPETKCQSSSCTKEDDRNSVERNLETLEKYVMTVLNGVIKDQEENDRESSLEKFTESTKMDTKHSDAGSTINGDEDSKDCEKRLEPSVPASAEAKVISFKGTSENDLTIVSFGKEKNLNDSVVETNKSLQTSQLMGENLMRDGEERNEKAESSKGEEEKEEEMSRPLEKINIERITDHEEPVLDSFHQKDTPREMQEISKKLEEPSKDSLEIQRVCKDLLNDLLHDIVQSVHQTKSKELLEVNKIQDLQERGSLETLTTSLHCSLPLEKVASVLQTCQTLESTSQTSRQMLAKTTAKAPSPTVRHLCLYCDRKFLSISLRQRHTERVHQLGGGRRSERNSRKPSQSCQYCSDKCVESLEGLFQHMIGNHVDKYHACLQCVTRYITREALVNHMNEAHNSSTDRSPPTHESVKETPSVKEMPLSSREKAQVSPKDKRIEDGSDIQKKSSVNTSKAPVNKDLFSNPGSPEFDSSFYSSVSCNIRENLLHHLDGKLQINSSSPSNSSTLDVKPQSIFEHNPSQIQFPIDISLTAATPVYSKDYSSEEFENSSEYAQKPKKNCRTHPRRVSFEKYNFPRKYDGKEQWTCSIKDLSKFDISTQLTLRKKQQLIKEKINLSRLNQIPILGSSNSEVVQTDFTESDLKSQSSSRVKESVENTKAGKSSEKNLQGNTDVQVDQTNEWSCSSSDPSTSRDTEFTNEFENFLRLQKLEDSSQVVVKNKDTVYAELTGEWSRPRIYICGACASRSETLKEMEDHKTAMHPNVWCSHYEFSGDQLELYKYLSLPGKSLASAKAKSMILSEKICTKCSKNCSSLSELHKHMLECGGDQTWLLGLFGNGKKKCKWRPFGSRSRRRRNRGMKRNIQNSQTPRVNVPREKQPSGPRVRPSDHESIQKMLANLPPKRATRKVLQESAARSQGRLRKVQTKSRSGLVETSSTRLSRNKAVLRNKLLKNAKSFQRKRCRSDNISATIETVVSYYNSDKNVDESINVNEVDEISNTNQGRSEIKSVIESIGRQTKLVKSVKVLSKRKTIKTKESIIRHVEYPKTRALKSKKISDSKLDSSLEISGAKITIKGETSKISENYVIKGKSHAEISFSQSAANNSLKKKRIVDSIASMNASLKAKSQLRTVDGKFARDPLKIYKSIQKSEDSNQPFAGPQITKIHRKVSSASNRSLRSKLKTVQNVRKDTADTSKKNSRLSTDIKIFTLESETQSPDKKESSGNLQSDLPSPLPHGSSYQPKVLRTSLRNSSLGRKYEGKETSQNKMDVESKEEIVEIDDKSKSEEGNGKRLKKVAKKAKEVKERKEIKRVEESSEQSLNVRGRPRKSLPAEISETKDVSINARRYSSSSTTKNREDDSENTENETVFVKKDEVATKGLETRGNKKSKKKLEDVNQTSKVSLENEQYSELKEDMLKNVALKPSKISRRIIKTQKSKVSDLTAESVTKKENTNTMRTSPRNAEKKNFSLDIKESEDDLLKKSSIVFVNANENFELKLNEVDNKLETQEQSAGEEFSESINETKIFEDTASNFESKTTTKCEKLSKSNSRVIEDIIEKSLGEKEISTEIKTSEIIEEVEVSKISKSPDLVNLSIEHIQQESCNSNMDSGKENSSEMSMSVVKLKVTRPKKTRNSRKERISKRTLNNVIGILTEGVNIPIEAQESVVLTLQTSVEISNPDNACQNNEPSRLENNSTSNESSVTGRNFDSNVIENTSDRSEIKEPKESDLKTGQSDEILKVDENKSNDPPTNDIILDLSRRKPKGKGSFLEKIVSKIAKKKDVLLEGDTSFSSETSNDNHNILINVGSIPSDSSMENVEQSLNNEKNKVDYAVSEGEDTSASKIEANELQNQNGSINSNSNDSENVDKNEDGNKKIFTRNSRKRSLDVNSPKKNKRKIATESPEETEEEKELCFSDIMSLVHKSEVSEEDIINEQIIVKEKAQTEGEKEETLNENEIAVEYQILTNKKTKFEAINTETPRNSKRKFKNENIQEEEVNNSLQNNSDNSDGNRVDNQKGMRKSTRKSLRQDNNDKVEKVTSDEKETKNHVSKSKELPEDSSIFEPSKLLLDIDKLLLSIEETNDNLKKTDGKSKNLAEEHLDLSDEDLLSKPLSDNVYHFSEESDDSGSAECFKRLKNRSTKGTDKDSDVEMFKVPNTFTTNKRPSKIKSLVHENFDSTDDLSSEDTSASEFCESVGLTSKESGDKSTKRRYSQRKQVIITPSESEDDVSTDSFSTVPKATFNEENIVGKRQTPGRKAKRNISLVDKHIILPGDESLEQENQSLEKENFDIAMVSSTEKIRPGRKSKKNVSTVDEDIPSEDAAGTDSEAEINFEKAVEDKLCEGIQTQLERSELVFVSNMEKARPARKSKKNAIMDKEEIVEENQEKQSIGDATSAESLTEIEASQSVLAEKKRRGRKPKRNIVLVDNVTNEISVREQMQLEEKISVDSLVESNSERKYNLEVQLQKEQNFLDVQNNLIEKKRRGRKPKSNILVDDVSSLTHTKEGLTEETMSASINSLEERKNLDTDHNKSPEKKRPGRKSKKRLDEEYLAPSDNTVQNDSLLGSYPNQETQEPETTKEVEMQPKNIEVEVNENKLLDKKREGRKSRKRISLNELVFGESNSNVSSQGCIESEIEEKVSDKLEEVQAEKSVGILINQTSFEKKRLGIKPNKSISDESLIPIDDASNLKEIVPEIIVAEVNKIVEEEPKDLNLPAKKKPRRKSNKNNSLVDKHLSLPDNIGEEINGVTKSLEIIESNAETNISEINILERKRQGRKPKKVISEQDNSAEEKTLIKNSEEELNNSLMEELDDKSPEELQARKLEILIQSSPLERKRPGRKAKKNISLVDDVFKDDFVQEKQEEKDLVMNNCSRIEENEVSQESKIGLKLEARIQNLVVEKKRPGRKPKKGVLLINEHLVLPDGNNTRSKESSEVLEDRSQRATSDINTVQNESVERKPRGRKTKKYISLCEEHLALPDADIPVQAEDSAKSELIVEDEEKGKTINADTIMKANDTSEILIRNTSLERKRPGRKAKKNISLVDEHLDLLDEFDVHKINLDPTKHIFVDIVKDKTSEELKASEAGAARIASSERKRKSSKRKAKNVSLLDEHLALSDENSSEKKEDATQENVSAISGKKNDNDREEGNNVVFEDISSSLEKITSIMTKKINREETLLNEHLDDKSTEAGTLEVEEQHLSTEESQNFEEPSDKKENVKTALEVLSNQEPSELKESLTDDFQTPKKRPVGNFAVVHTKSGEILIVEKKKKLTKEAAKFFCDICATSFTRKSSLKKHNLSQSHLLQIYHTPGKEQEKEIAAENEENILTNNEKVEKMEENLIINKTLEKKEKLVSEKCAESLDVLNELLDQHFEKNESVLLEKTPIPVTTPTSTEKPLPAESQAVENIDDELLDEEICKITENMTHDEYVLTDHISPIFPENASTPIKNLKTKAEVSEKGSCKKKSKKKKNLANEHLDLDTPEPNLDSNIISQNSLNDDIIDKNTTAITNISDIEETILKPLLEDSNELYIQKPEGQIEVEEAKISNEINVSEKRKTRKQTAREEKSLEANTDIDNSTKRVSLRSGRNQEKKEETSRPKRNQHKQNYKEYECFDFDQGESDLIIPTNKRETSKSRKVTSSSRESSRSKKKQDKEEEIGKNKEQKGPQNIIEKRSKHKFRKGDENSDSLTQILGTENESHSASVKISDGERIQDSLPPTFIDDCPKSISKIEDSLTATFGRDGGLKLDFLNVAETLKAQTSQVKFNANESVVTEFDSDDNSLHTDMSVDIQKLLDDPELSIDNNSTQTNSQAAFNNDNTLSNVNESGLIESDISSSIDTSAIETLPLNEIIDGEVGDSENIDKTEDEIVNIETEVSETIQSVENINQTDTQDLKTNDENQKTKFIKGQKVRSKQKKGSSKCKITNLNDIESDNEDTSETQNKSQIVRSVFGRVFGGEKVDKVKEVLDDWNSKSESSDNEFNKYKEADSSRTSRESSKQKIDQKKDLKRRSRNSSTSRSTSRGVSQKKKSGFDSQEDQDSLPLTKSNASRNSLQNRQAGSQLKTSRVESSLGTSELLITSLRCRESKKRAEERISTISRAFDDESPIPDDVRLDKSQKASKTKGFPYEFRNKVRNISESLSQDSGEHLESTNREACSKKSKKRNGKEDINDFNQCLKNELELNEPLNYNLDQESISSVEPSLRSHSPVSQLSQNSEEDDDEIEDDLLRRRMSPFFVCNNSYTSLGSSTNSENEASEDEIIDKEEADEKEQLRRKSCSSEFSGEKIVIRSPLACHEDRPEIVTIAPTDAIEDNALDVPQEIVSATSMTSTVHHKSRQGKVLNFDQELFVECCSRLKATTENELRGAKKIKLDHSENYRKDDPSQLFRPSKDRWRDVESQNSLGSLLESVNQLLGEEMYSNNEKDNHGRDNRSEFSSRSVSPDASRADNLGYEDSLDVAFEHNNKLRDKIQQRMRESENLISNTFAQKSNNSGDFQHSQFMQRDDREESVHVYGRVQNQFSVPSLNIPNGICGSASNKGNQSLHGGLLDKALSNLLHNSSKHDHNGSSPMKVLAELACARAPTSTASAKLPTETQDIILSTTSVKDPVIKKNRNPIKELFERKRELYERKQIERANTDVFVKESNTQKSRRTKKTKKKQEFPLIRNDYQDGLAEKKKRREVFEKKEDFDSSRAKDIYDFDDEESQIESGFNSVLSYRSKVETDSFRERKFDMSNLMSKAIGDTLGNGKTGKNLNQKLESMIDHKFKDIENFAPKTKGALKSFQSEDKLITGPMDDFIERRKSSKRATEQLSKHPKLKKKSKSAKKNSRNAWYENDSSDEFVTAAKTNDVGVGISKSQRTCSKGKQNLFAELFSSSENESLSGEVPEEIREYEREKDLGINDIENENSEIRVEICDDKYFENEDKNREDRKSLEDVGNEDYNWDRNRKDYFESVTSESDSESESELIIDLKKDSEENRDSESDEPEEEGVRENEDKKEAKDEHQLKKEWIPLEEALNILDQHDNLDGITDDVNKFTRTSRTKSKRTESESSGKFNKESKENYSHVDEQETPDDDLPILPEKLTTNEKPQKEPENLPLHVFLSRKVQESKKRKQQQRKNKKLQQASMTNFEPIRRQRKCAIGKQGLLAEISSSDEEVYFRAPHRKLGDKIESERPRKQKKESKEKRKERYIEKKHEQMIAKEQKAIEEQIMREFGKIKDNEGPKDSEDDKEVMKVGRDEDKDKSNSRKHQKQKSLKSEETEKKNDSDNSESPKERRQKPNLKSKKNIKSDGKGKNKIEKPKSRRNSVSNIKNSRERRLSISKRDSGDEELRTTKSWNKVDEAVGVAIGRRKRAAVNQLYYWSSSSDEEETIEAVPAVEEEDDRLEQHGWIVGDSHKKMITMLAMEKQLKEKRRRSEDECESGKGKTKKHRNSTS